MRAGAHALSLLSVPLNAQILKALRAGPMPLVDLRRAVGLPPETTMRGHLRDLTGIGVLQRRRRENFPGSVDYEVDIAGRSLLAVAAVLDSWLEGDPKDSVQLGTPAAKSIVRALSEGWTTTLVRALATRPLMLTDLNRLITSLNYPSLERRLGAMRVAGLIEPSAGEGRGTPYAVTDRLRRGIAPILAAAQWEHRWLDDGAAPLSRIDVEAIFLLAAPRLVLPPEMSGTCRLAVELQSRPEPTLAGAVIEVRDGTVVSCVSRLGGQAEAWASGSVSSWLRALVSGETSELEIGGDCDLALAVAEGMHRRLFRPEVSLRP